MLRAAMLEAAVLGAFGVAICGLLVACGQPAATTSVNITVTAGPVCPVVRDPPDPSCADRPVEGAALVVLADAAGGERVVTTAHTNSAGVAVLSLPEGSYTVRPQPVAGLMGTPGPLRLVVGGTATKLSISYDTGIR